MQQGTPHLKLEPQKQKKNDKKKNKWVTRASIARMPGRSQAAIALACRVILVGDRRQASLFCGGV